MAIHPSLYSPKWKVVIKYNVDTGIRRRRKMTMIFFARQATMAIVQRLHFPWFFGIKALTDGFPPQMVGIKDVVWIARGGCC